MIKHLEETLDRLCERFGLEYIADLMIDNPTMTCDEIGELAYENERESARAC